MPVRVPRLDDQGRLILSAMPALTPATATEKGVIEVATPAEALAGIAPDLAVTPEGLQAVRDDIAVEVSDTTLAKASHLADLPDKVAARTSLGVPSTADVTASIATSPGIKATVSTAIADGASHPLSTRFSTLAAAQAVYPAALALTDETDWAAIASVTSVYGGAVLPPGSYVINKTIVCSWLRGQDARARIFQLADNIPIVQCPAGLTRLENLFLEYINDQPSTNTGADGIQLNDCLQSSYLRGITVRRAATGIRTASGFTFSTTFSDLDICGFSLSGFDIGGGTGNVVNNLYVHNNPTPDGIAADAQHRQVSLVAAVRLRQWTDGVLNQVNVEWTRSPNAIILDDCAFAPITFNSIHIEGFVQLGSSSGTIALFRSGTGAIINGLTIYNSVYNAVGVSDHKSGIFKLYSDTASSQRMRLTVRGLDARTNTMALNFPALVLTSGLGTGANFGAMVKLSDVQRGSFTLDQIGDATDRPVIRELNLDLGGYVRNMSQNVVAGRWYATPAATLTTGIPPEATERGAFMVVGRDCTIDQLAVSCTVAGSTGALVRLGLRAHDETTGQPGALLADGGTVAATATGVLSVTLATPVKVQAGTVVWLTATVQGGATTRPTLRQHSASLVSLGDATAATALDNILGGVSAGSTAGALPATQSWSHTSSPYRVAAHLSA